MAVLIVEDEPWLSLDISEALEDEGYDVIAVAYADNGIEALEARNDINTVFTDLDVRGSNGRIETGCRRKRALAAC